MKRFSILEAVFIISIIRRLESDRITHIEYEDGSGLKFNYTIDGERKEFIDLSTFREDMRLYFGSLCKNGKHAGHFTLDELKHC